VYFVANALQQFMAPVISSEGRDYFGFVLIGTAMLTLVSAALSSFASAVSGGLSSGFFEALLVTPTSLGPLLAGQTGYAFVWAAARAILLVGVGAFLGVDLRWLRLPEAMLVTMLLMIAAALVVSFRTNAAIPQGVLVISTLLGGVYFPTSVLPPVMAPIAEWLPLTPGLRALRQALLLGYPLSAISGDLLQLAGLALGCAVVGGVALRLAFRYARKAGSLGQY
jgi:ABC-2 type transport system permease protein